MRGISEQVQVPGRAPYRPEREGGTQHVKARAYYWGQAMLNQQRSNAAYNRPLRPSSETVASMTPSWSGSDVLGQGYSCRNIEGEEIFVVGKLANGVWVCWECQGCCCAHIVEALFYMDGKNEVAGGENPAE